MAPIKRNSLKSSEIRLGGCVLDMDARTLTGAAGEPVDLRYQSMSVLLALARRRGETLSRQALIKTVWPAAHVSDDSLSQCIADIRRAIGDDGRRLLETVPREGYRLNEEVVTNPRRWRLAAIATGAMLVVVAAIVGDRFDFGPAADRGAAVVAVLPFDDVSDADHVGFLSDALAEGIITDLARFPQFRVIARNSSFQFREGSTDIRDLGAKLGADYVVEGSQQYDGTSVRATVQLIETDSGTHVYSGRFDRALTGLFAVQDDIVRQVASAVGGMVLGQIPARNTRGQVGAMLRGLHARNLMTTPTREHWQEAFALEQSSMRDFPDSPWGYIGSALMLLNGSFQGFIDRPRDEVLDEAEDLAERALAMAPDNYMGHYTAARVLATRGHFREALRQFEEAARLNPSDPLVLIAMSMPLLFTGDTERAKAILEHARSVDPLHGDWLLVQLGWAHWQAGECEKGLDAMHRMASPPVSSLTMLASLQICTGDTAQARETIAALLEARPDYSIQEEIRINPSDWKPDGTLERWLDGLRQAGLPG